MAPTRRKGTAMIPDQRERNETFSKRSKGQIKKSSCLNSITGASIAFIALPTEAIKREVHYYGSPSVEEVCFEFFRQRCESSMTNEERASLTMKCRALLDCLDKKSKDNAGACHGSGVKAGAGKDSKKKWETSHPSVLAFPKDSDDRDKCSTSEADSATTSSESSDMDFDEYCDHLEVITNLPKVD